jgi:PTH2 family peptidyl-tRNA hydrolase
MEDDIKQVIVVRKDLNMRKGKIAAQAAHASIAVVTKLLGPTEHEHRILHHHEDLFKWLAGDFKKIVVGCDSEAELLDLSLRARGELLLHALIQDNGLTEFHGVKTYTALAVGPGSSKIVDRVTGHLKLM